MSGIRSTHRWQVLRAALIADATHCAICHRPLMRGAPGRSRHAPTVDHIIPLSLGGAPFDGANLRVVCYSCNSRRGNGLASRRRASVMRADPDGWLGIGRSRSW